MRAFVHETEAWLDGARNVSDKRAFFNACMAAFTHRVVDTGVSTRQLLCFVRTLFRVYAPAVGDGQVDAEAAEGRVFARAWEIVLRAGALRALRESFAIRDLLAPASRATLEPLNERAITPCAFAFEEADVLLCGDGDASEAALLTAGVLADGDWLGFRRCDIAASLVLAHARLKEVPAGDDGEFQRVYRTEFRRLDARVLSRSIERLRASRPV